MKRLSAGLLVSAVLVAGCGGGSSSSQSSTKEISNLSFVMKTLYCSYGSESKAQFSGCVHHVSIEQVLNSQTQAGEYGRGELKTCGSESGPGCASTRKVLEKQFPRSTR